jgi:hypothetical protein
VALCSACGADELTKMSDSSIFKVGKKMASIGLDEPRNRIFQDFSEGGSKIRRG